MNRIFYGWWIVLACFFISFYVGGIVFFGFTAFIQPIRDEFGWSYTEISIAAGLRGLEMGFFAPAVGFLVDRFGARRLMFAGTITMGFGLLLLSFTGSLITFYTASLLLALGAGGCTSVVTMTLVANWFQRNVGVALGVMTSGFGASGLLVPLIVRLIDTYGWRSTLVIFAVAMWIVGIPLTLLIRNRPEEYGVLPDGEVFRDIGQAGQGETTPPPADVTRLIDLLRTRSFFYLNFLEFIRMMSVTAVVTHIMPCLGHIGIDRSIAGMAAAAIPLWSIAGRFGFGWLGDLFDKRRVMAMTFFLMSAGLLSLSYAEALWALILFLLLFPPGLGGSMVIRGAILREYFGRKSFGKMIGIVMGSASIGGIIGPTMAGWSLDGLNSYTPVWVALFGLTLLATVLTRRVTQMGHS